MIEAPASFLVHEMTTVEDRLAKMKSSFPVARSTTQPWLVLIYITETLISPLSHCYFWPSLGVLHRTHHRVILTELKNCCILMSFKSVKSNVTSLASPCFVPNITNEQKLPLPAPTLQESLSENFCCEIFHSRHDRPKDVLGTHRHRGKPKLS